MAKAQQEQQVGHTPGPWVTDPYAQFSVYSSDETGSIVAKTGGPGLEYAPRPDAERKANAHLIAAAPSYHAAVELVKADAGELDGDNAGYVAITVEAYHALMAAHEQAAGR